MAKTISYDDYLRLVGLLTLAADHRKALGDIERSACALTGQTPGAGGHTSDEIWGQERGVQGLLEVLDIVVQKEESNA